MVDKLRLEVLLAAVDRVTGPLQKIATGSKATAAAIGEAEAALKRLEWQQRMLQKQHDAISSAAAQRKDLRAMKQELAALQQAGPLTKKVFEAKTRAIEKETQAYETQRNKVKSLRAEIRAMNLGNATQAQKTLAASIAATNAQLDAQRGKMERQAQVEQRLQTLRDKHSASMMKMAKWGGAAAGAQMAGQKLSSALMAPITTYAKAETAETQLKISFMQADGSVVPEFQQILKLANDLGDRLPGTTADFINMMTVLRKEGMSAQAVLGGLGEAAANLGVLLQVGPQEAAAKMAKMQDSLRATEAEMPEVADLMQRANYLGADMSFMQSAIGNASPVMDIMKVQGAEAMRVLAPMAVMMNQAGMEDGSSVGNAVRKIHDRAMSSKRVKKANGVLKESGAKFKLDFTDGKGEFGGMEKLFDQLAKLRELSTEDRLAVINALWGDDAETNRVLTKWIESNKDGYSETVRKMQAQADLNQRVQEQLNTLENKWDSAGGSFSNLLKTLGDSISPQLKGLIDRLGGLASEFNQWAQANPRIVKTLMMLAAGGAALLVVLGTLGVALAGMLGTLAMVRMLSGRFALNLLGMALGGKQAGQGAGLAARAVGGLVAAWAAFRRLGVAGVLRAIGPELVQALAPLRTLSGLWATLRGGLWGIVRLVFAFARANPLAAMVMGLIGVFAGFYAHWDKITAYFDAGQWWDMAKEIWAALEWGLNAASLGVYELLKTMAMKAIGAAWDGIKSFIGMGGDQAPESTPARVARTTAAAAAMAAAVPLSAGVAAQTLQLDTYRPAVQPMTAIAPRAAAAPGVTNHNAITIHAAPGMDERAVARAVSFEMDRLARANASRRFSALSDGE